MFRAVSHSQKTVWTRSGDWGLLAAFDRVAGSGNQENSQFKVEMMLVSGYAGIGKSALVQELYKPLTAKGVILSGVSLTLLAQYSYSAIVDALKNWCSNYWGSRRASATVAIALCLRQQRTNHHWCHPWSWVNYWQAAGTEVGATQAQNRFNLIFQVCAGVLFKRTSSDLLGWFAVDRLSHAEVNRVDAAGWEPNIYFWLEPIEIMKHPTHPLVLTLETCEHKAVLQEIVLHP